MPTVKKNKDYVAWLFPGQGSQKKGMGLELVEKYPEIMKSWEQHTDIDFWLACSGQGDYFSRTDSLQPILYTVNYIYAIDAIRHSRKPDLLAGHSLGEITALVVGGMLDYSTGLRLAIERGKLMNSAPEGGMLAVVNADLAELKQIILRPQFQRIDIANYNSPSETVFSGPSEDLHKFFRLLRSNNIQAIPLRVSSPFHSRYMNEAASLLYSFCLKLNFAEAKIPIVSNVNAELYTPELAPHLIAHQVKSPVQWHSCVLKLRSLGASSALEVGPGNVLTRLWQDNTQLAKPITQTKNTANRSLSQDENSRFPETERNIAIRSFGEVAWKKPPNSKSNCLGSSDFCAEYGIKHAYASGSMFRGISSIEMVKRMSLSGYLSFFGSGGLNINVVEKCTKIISSLPQRAQIGINLLYQARNSAAEEALVTLALKNNISVIEASAYTDVTAELVRYRFSGARSTGGFPHLPNRLIMKLSRTDIAEKFLVPPPSELIELLVSQGKITPDEASVARNVPIASDICVESDSGGHTDHGSALILVPAIKSLARSLEEAYRLQHVRIGAAGGVGTPDAILGLTSLGAEFVVTGSINQCTPEAGTSDLAKDLLARAGIHDMATAPAADLFELDGQVQVLRKGTLFAARANQLHRVFRLYRSWDEVPSSVKKSIEKYILRSSYEEALSKVYGRSSSSDKLNHLEKTPRARMAAVFRTYLIRSTTAAINGVVEESNDFQIHCGPAMGAFNRWASGTILEDWRNRHVDVIADTLINAAICLNKER